MREVPGDLRAIPPLTGEASESASILTFSPSSVFEAPQKQASDFEAPPILTFSPSSIRSAHGAAAWAPPMTTPSPHITAPPMPHRQAAPRTSQPLQPSLTLLPLPHPSLTRPLPLFPLFPSPLSPLSPLPLFPSSPLSPLSPLPLFPSFPSFPSSPLSPLSPLPLFPLFPLFPSSPLPLFPSSPLPLFPSSPLSPLRPPAPSHHPPGTTRTPRAALRLRLPAARARLGQFPLLAAPPAAPFGRRPGVPPVTTTILPFPPPCIPQLP
ncbi:unnamed protein product [Closterium sp. Yama58-4]|nr:unnamed protein product [Closterium sp. Yama58-4]